MLHAVGEKLPPFSFMENRDERGSDLFPIG